ncbi:MAG: argininosuccinate lyase [Sphingobacteriia bacterium 24-36-13]|jgi:argininosuccinate lyase|uniref:argininosuccinate lyase n=1 Tax=Sediminibacterium sp. TaxID=1917865 RepID=UPI000BD3D87F|nr:argininosuccinate lyase [Sediminibacterium sp.]OYY09239.1 MAG: argininosuccinate lyase [Sphingobacteriia bacterium 35-36-14]OYZ52605.1 MAG: argininosuccinate lyase [Sphingobacteriia bacterium 24-36-13]OZA63960.1 MAG: argininosuccinate lyase [Sphingobacteriia bacterium 39-36-14]HQS25429.1 argininosuccinate lyase [Sediminibacterium sp.]HQS35774.1 argininosuccinate lyase [Sediminibacterium sp.]
MKLWSKSNTNTTQEVEKFTVGKDKDFDTLLAPYDVLGSIAHVKMLASIGLLTNQEMLDLVKELQSIYQLVIQPDFVIPEGVEDIHSYVELVLTQKLGDMGKKIHSARSRNDQVLVDIKLYLRAEIKTIAESTYALFELLQQKSEAYKNHLLPGYTHLQLAMPSSFGLWFGAYAESLVDDLTMLEAAYTVVNKNPLGSAAGYGSSFPINRTMTTDLLGFEQLNYNVVYAQMGRGKTERIVATALANIADTLARMSMDACLYLNQNFAFISFPPELTTGSSIMPHKKNPDVFELTRSYCNRIKALPNEISLMTTNLPSGYQRDLQLLKEHLFPAFIELNNCIEMMQLMFSHIQVSPNIADDPKFQYMFSVEEVNKLVLKGVPFRDAYQQIGNAIENGQFNYSTSVNHKHEGSMGNLCNAEIKSMMDQLMNRFQFSKATTAFQLLLT